MGLRYNQLHELMINELRVSYFGMKEDPNEDFAIEVYLNNYLTKEPALISVLIDFFEKCDILELRLKLAAVILDYAEFKPAFDLLVEEGRTPTWLSSVYITVHEMIKKGVITF